MIYIIISKFLDWYLDLPLVRMCDRMSTRLHTKLVRNPKTNWISRLLRRLSLIDCLMDLQTDLALKLELMNVHKPMYYVNGEPVFSSSSMDDFTESQWTTLPK